jgi:hypothetical protein
MTAKGGHGKVKRVGESMVGTQKGMTAWKGIASLRRV